MIVKDKNFLVTGGSLGIGKSTAKLLIDKGAKVAITGRNESRLKETASEIGAHPIQADVSKAEDVQRTYKEYRETFKSLDGLINNAGTGGIAPLVDIDPDELMRIWSVNILGAVMMGKEAAKMFIEQNHGNIVNIGSTASHRGYAGGTAYAGSKFALKGISECWRAELRKHNVRVFTIYPSEVTTAWGSAEGIERPEEPNKLRAIEIAHSIVSALEMDDRGFIPDLTVHATNPF